MGRTASVGVGDAPRTMGERALSWFARVLSRDSVHRRMLSAAAVVAFFAFVAKLLGATKEFVVAHEFGISDQVDAFGLALTFPAFAISLIGGSLNAALVPAYVDVRQREGQDGAQRLFSAVMVLSLALLVLAALLTAALVPTVLPLVSSRFTPGKLRLTAHLSYLLIPTIVIAGTSMTCAAVLNAHERFGPPSAAGLAVPLVSIAALVGFGRASGIQALAVGVVVGYCAEAFFLVRAVRREGLSIVPRWGGFTPAVRKLVGQFAPMVAGALVMGSNPVVDSVMAARLDPGSVASLGYGGKLVAFAMGIGSMSLGAAIFPHFSRLASMQDWDGLARTIRAYALVVLAITIPATLVAIALSEPIVRILYERGAFGRADTVRVALVQALYLIGVPFFLTSLVFVRFLSATARNSVLMRGAILNCCVNVVGNVVLSRYLGPAGIALSTSVVYTVSFVFLGWCTWRRLGALRSPPPQPAS